MDTALAVLACVLAALYLLRRAVRTFDDPQAGACGGSEGCGSACSTDAAPDPPLVQLELPR